MNKIGETCAPDERDHIFFLLHIRFDLSGVILGNLFFEVAATNAGVLMEFLEPQWRVREFIFKTIHFFL